MSRHSQLAQQKHHPFPSQVDVPCTFEQPRDARAGPDGTDRRNIDPPPIPQLLLTNFNLDSSSDLLELRSNDYVVHCKLISAESSRRDFTTHTTISEDGSSKISHTLLNTNIASSFFCANDPDIEGIPHHPKSENTGREVASPSASNRFIQNRDLGSCPYVRISQDTIPEHSMFVYEYLTNHLLSLARRDLPAVLTKRTLRDALRALIALHDRNIAHTDVKPNNILVEWTEDDKGIAVEKVQLADIEDAAPEAHARGRINKPSDMWSFGIVSIYAVFQRVIFAVDEEELEPGVELLAVVLERQISHFADQEGLDAFLKHLGPDNPWCKIFEVIRDGFNKTNPRRPFSLLSRVDPEFRDLIAGLTNFDPAKRLTAHEALAHKWFQDG